MSLFQSGGFLFWDISCYLYFKWFYYCFLLYNTPNIIPIKKNKMASILDLHIQDCQLIFMILPMDTLMSNWHQVDYLGLCITGQKKKKSIKFVSSLNFIQWIFLNDIYFYFQVSNLCTSGRERQGLPFPLMKILFEYTEMDNNLTVLCFSFQFTIYVLELICIFHIVG